MGADVHIVLGRINLEAVQERKRIGTVQSDSTALVLFEGLDVDADDFTLMNVPAEYDLNRNYALFGWLSNVRVVSAEAILTRRKGVMVTEHILQIRHTLKKLDYIVKLPKPKAKAR